MVASVWPLAALEWTLDWGWGARVLVSAVALAVLALSWWNLRPLTSRSRKVLLLALRGALVGTLFVVFLEPNWVEERQRPGGRVVAVVLDDSASMSRDSGGGSRWKRALAAARTLAADSPVSLHVGSDSVRVVRLAELAAHEARGEQTDLLAMLTELGDLKRPPGLGAVVLISDGLDNGNLARRRAALAKGQLLDERTTAVLARLGVPVHGLAIEDAEPLRDLAVTAIRASPHAFVRNVLPVAVELELVGYGAEPGQARVILRLDGTPIIDKAVPLMGPERRTLRLEVQPQQTGPHVLSASISPLPGEATVVNNTSHTTIKVLRDRTRVMHLAGHPSWDSRFLRTHLNADPAIDLISFYVMVGQGARFYVRAQDTTLIPFPTRELFEKALHDFDLVIFQDFQFVPFDIGRYLPLLDDFIRQGGAFAIIGGHQSLSAGGHGSTPMAGWLPVELRAPGPDQGYRDEPFAPQLTPAGRNHPVTRLAATPSENDASWSRNALVGHNTAIGPRADAVVLATADDNTPLVAVADRGKGRVAVIATDGLWRWAFAGGDAVDRDASRADYHRFLEQLRGWLTHDPAYDAIVLRATQPTVDPGATATVKVKVRGLDGGPAVGVPVRFRVRSLKADSVIEKAAPWQAANQPTADDGMTIIRWPDAQPGAHRMEVEATIAGTRHTASIALAVRETGPEQRRLGADSGLLEALAKGSGGVVWRGRRAMEEVPMVHGGNLPELTEKARSELWSSPWAALLLIVLLAVEWWLRRRWGLA